MAQLEADGEFAEQLFVHGLGVQTAEGLAEWLHWRVRSDLGIADTQGRRYSWGYPAVPGPVRARQGRARCSDLAQIGMEHLRRLRADPEQSTLALDRPPPAGGLLRHAQRPPAARRLARRRHQGHAARPVAVRRRRGARSGRPGGRRRAERAAPASSPLAAARPRAGAARTPTTTRSARSSRTTCRRSPPATARRPAR